MEKEVCLGVTAGGVHIYHCAFRAQILPKKQDPNNIARTVARIPYWRRSGTFRLPRTLKVANLWTD
jgi:hypothetical protein